MDVVNVGDDTSFRVHFALLWCISLFCLPKYVEFRDKKEWNVEVQLCSNYNLF